MNQTHNLVEREPKLCQGQIKAIKLIFTRIKLLAKYLNRCVIIIN